ncbi:MAG: formyltetrahydrofolate deformylase [Succinivibrio sp.]|nr:formyltetrahydrofolate deformylase [Succinivibrio sp.]
MEKRILLTECADSTGLIAKVTQTCFEHQLNVVRQDQFASAEDSKFFMRTVLEGDFSCQDSVIRKLEQILPEGAKVRLNDNRRRRLCVLVTKEAHCLGELLMKCYSGTLNADIVCVAGNYPVLSELAHKFDVPFKLVSCEGISREEQEERMMKVIDEANADYVILAKYMRILSHEMVSHYPLGKLINIHHSFLPAFMGARPYEQAFRRGVKIIGATAHFVTDNLDEGPIIQQDVIKVNHRYDPEALAKAGHDVEQMVLLRAITKVLDDKVFIHGNKTVVF